MGLKSDYRGLVAPVFTPFTSTDELNVHEIPKYARYLQTKNVKAVLVNGTVGEGALMTIGERMKVAEEWVRVAKITGQKIMVHVGATNLHNVLKLAKHAEDLGVWALLCLPDLFFRPSTIDGAVEYMVRVSEFAPKTALFYYHYPALTGVTLNMVEFLDKAYSQIPTLAGIKFTHNNLDEGIRCVQLRQHFYTIFIACDQLFSAAYFLGADSAMLTTLNFAADEIHKVQNAIDDGKNVDARNIQERITDLVYFVTNNVQFGSGFKNIISQITGLNLGNTRPPLQSVTQEESLKLKDELKRKNWI